jgi:hypothetical protein
MFAIENLPVLEYSPRSVKALFAPREKRLCTLITECCARFQRAVCRRVKHSQPEYGRTSVPTLPQLSVAGLTSCSLTSLRRLSFERPSFVGELESWKDEPNALADGFMTSPPS